MYVQQIMSEIQALPYEGQMEILSRLKNWLNDRERLLKSLDEIRGAGKGVWNEDAQQYINRLRADDRN